MKKFQLFILILVVGSLFAFADYFVNVPDGIPSPKPSLPAATQNNPQTTAPEAVSHPNVTKQILDQAGQQGVYTIEKRTRSTELFETFDLSSIANVSAYKNVLINNETKGQLPVYVYEIHGPAGQGSITYLNVKLAMIEQIGSEVGINETGDLGFSSLFYNDASSPLTGYLLSEIGDVVFGFKYSKDSEKAFDFVRSLVNNYMSLIQ